jgi:hypothetical protein
MADSVSLQQNAKYDQNGLTVLSNNTSVNERDSNGNVIIHTTSSLLIIEAITTNYLTESILPLIDTQFNYFKFPARTAVVDETADLDIDLDLDFTIPDIQVPGTTSATPATPAEYKPSTDQQVAKSSELQPLDFSVVVTGPAQTETSAFTITQEVLNLLDAAPNKTLVFKSQITSYYNSNNNSKVEFNIKQYKTNDTSELLGGNTTPSGDNVNNKGRVTKKGTYVSDLTYQIDITELSIGDYFKVVGIAEDQSENRNHTVLANNSYVQITAA